MERTMAKEITVGITEFKAKCTKLLADVEKRRVSLTVTRRGRPVARVLNTETETPSLHGYMKGTFDISGDVIAPAEPDWNVLAD
jgi:prevent-host-death family protein